MNIDKLRFSKLFLLILPFIFYLLPSFSQTLAPGAFGAPGKDAQWATAGKQAIGTSASLESKVWFTLANGAMTEVYYPNVTVANVHKLEFVIFDSKTKQVETETEDAYHTVEVVKPDSLTFRQINKAKNGGWEILKTYTTDPELNSILISVTFTPRKAGLELYVYYDPSLNNSGMHDSAWTQGNVFLASEGDKASALVCKTDSCSFSEMTNSFLGKNDGIEQLNGIEQLKRDGKIIVQRQQAGYGNVVQMAHIKTKYSVNNYDFFQIALGFGKTADEALQTAVSSAEKGFVQTNQSYEKGWADYVKTLPKVDPKYQAQFNMAAMILKAYEDKTYRGANIASLSIPWGGGANANEVGSSGYHAVWARDLYQVATAFIAIGDKDAANRALDFLFKVQQKSDGSFPQNSWIDGKPIGGSLQMDEVAFPLILAEELGRFDKETYEKHIKPAVDFIVKNGPITPQERWEEKGGFSPSTIAAEIAGLVCAAEIAKKNGDTDSATRWLKTADEWQANIEKWTVTTTGKYSKSPYYVRLTQNGKPDAGEKYEINGVYGMVDERDIIDAGFLELVRLGIKSPGDKIIQNSLKVVDQVIKVNTPNGEGFYRYNLDSYGEPDSGQRWNFDGKYTGKGRLWALLSGERGEYEIAYAPLVDDTPVTEPKEHSVTLGSQVRWSARTRLDAMVQFANDGLMIPEQVWDSPNIPKNIDKQFVPELKFGEGTGSATPLAWSMAQFIRLAVNLKEGRNLDTPKVVYDRYVLGKSGQKSVVSGQEELTQSQESITSDKNWDELKYFPKKNMPSLLKLSNPIIADCGATNIFANPFNFDNPLGKSNCDSSKIALACFFYEGKAESIEIAGDFTQWKPSAGMNLQIAGRCLTFAKTARVEYKLIVDGKWITDPLNPNKVDNGVGGENSFFTMPDYKPTIWDRDDKLSVEPSNPKEIIDVSVPPVVKELEVNSKQFGKHIIKVYLPNDYEFRDKTAPYPALYFQDGSDYINRAKAIQIQNNLVKANKLKPFIMVFLDPKDRMKEYWANDDYAKFLAEEVVPMIDSKYNTIKFRNGRAVLGASLGGITAVNVGLKYPDIFSRIGGQSSSFWIDNERVVKDLEKLDGKTKFKFYFDDGTLEGVEDSRKVVKILQAKNFDVTYIESEAGHNWTAWRDRLADAFIAIWK